MNLGDPLPPFDGVEWLDGNGPSVPNGVVVLVHFWSTGCPLCHEGAAAILAWRRRREDRLVSIAVFAPRLDATAAVDIDSVRRDARDLMRVDQACALDRDRSLSARFDCLYAPAYFVFDAAGALRHRQTGNDHLHALGALVERLIKASIASEA